MKKTRLKVITNRREHRLAVKAIEDLWEAKPGSEEHDSLEVLALLVDDYEKRVFLTVPDGGARPCRRDSLSSRASWAPAE